jgi:large subunit ribosomal protein L21
MAKDFVVIKIGNSQEIVTKGDEILVNKIEGKSKDKITFEQVLLTNKGGKIVVGKPNVAGEKVEAQIVEQTKGAKVHKRTYKAKARQRRNVGHRQELTKIKIVSI